MGKLFWLSAQVQWRGLQSQTLELMHLVVNVVVDFLLSVVSTDQMYTTQKVKAVDNYAQNFIFKQTKPGDN